jgi:hypothetical protein
MHLGAFSILNAPRCNNTPSTLSALLYARLPAPPLLEFGSLPSAIFFAECFISGTRQRSSLPSATQKTLGKIKHSAKLFAECFIFDTRQRVSLPSVFFDTRQRALCRVSQIQHSAKSSLPSVFSPTLAKDNLKITF